MNVLFVSRVEMNPYVSLLAAGMERAVPGTHCTIVRDLSPRDVWRQRRTLDAIHLHWAELLYASGNWRAAWLKWLRLAASLLLAKGSGICLAYTVHNIAPHEGQHPTLNRLANALLFRCMDVVHVHNAQTQQEVAARFGRRRGVTLIPHGNYLHYPNHCTRAEARARLGLGDDLFIYLALGQIRPYKGVEELLAAFSQLPASDSHLIIAGHVHDPAYGAQIRKLAMADARVTLHDRYVPDEEIQYWMNASDVCVLPYRHVTTSGAAILAFSFGKPVIAPKLGDFSQLVGATRGILYDASDDWPTARQERLCEALRLVRSMDLHAASNAAWAKARELDWVIIGRQHLAAYAQQSRCARLLSGQGGAG